MPPKETVQTTKAQAVKPGEKRARSPEPKSVPEGEKEVAERAGKRIKTGATANNDPPSASAGPHNQSADAGELAYREALYQPEPEFKGKFDLYAQRLPFLSKVYLPPGTSSPQPVALYKTILRYQAKPDFTGQCLLPTSRIRDALLESGVICDPMDGSPLRMSISYIKEVPKMKFTAKEQSYFVSFQQLENPGIEGETTIEDMHCGLSDAHGTFKMRRLWIVETEGSADGDTDDSTDGGTGEFVELFEGYLSLNVKYSGLYSRKGHGSGEDHAFAFWAVRARKDARGEEIGLEAS